ncbi:MAG: RNA methyltransferase [Acidimicrobiaceae bacterium]|nr:RNA methyltransferase [Acidimicrobiia bacterium]MCY4492982.1 RNA methyltransferase [Acidimicrobiaceae bacterium]
MDRDLVKGPSNRRVVELRRLIERPGARPTETVLEGDRTVGEALDAGLRPTTVVVPERGIGDFDRSSLRSRLDGSVEVLVVRDKVFQRLAPSVTPQPVLAVIERPAAQVPTSFGVDDFALVLVGVADPGNVGTLIRVADAAGAVCVAVAGGADPWRPKAVRASAGSVLRVPVVSGDDVHEMLRRFRGAGAKIVATDVREGLRHDSGVLTGPLAIVLGAESGGLDRSIDSLVDVRVRIDMPGNAESLNVAMAGTLLAFEASKKQQARE